MFNDDVNGGVGKAYAEPFFQGWVKELILVGMECKDDWRGEEATAVCKDDLGADDDGGEGIVKSGVRQ